MHAIVFAYIWSSTQSLAVSTVYHAAFDEVRDTLEGSVGLGPLSQNWQMLILTILGILNSSFKRTSFSGQSYQEEKVVNPKF